MKSLNDGMQGSPNLSAKLSPSRYQREMKMSKLEDQISAAARSVIAEKMRAKIDEALLGAIYTTQSATPAETTLRAEDMIRKCEQIMRNMRRENITFVVDLAHQGPPLMHETPCDGKRIEMNFTQAKALHQQWPIKLHEVLTTTSAEFVPVNGVFPEFVSSVLPLPPFELPRECQHEKTLNFKYTNGSTGTMCHDCGKVLGV